MNWGEPDWEEEHGFVDVDDPHDGLVTVTAWRALADLKAEDAVEPLIELLCALGDSFDDWVCEELPTVFGEIGEAAVAPLKELTVRAEAPEFARSCAARGLRQIAKNAPQTRDSIAAFLTEVISCAAENDIDFNSTLMCELVELHAVEAAEPIERAFAGNRIDVGMMGDWERVSRELGVQGLGLEMPETPVNSVAEFRLNSGVGVFSNKPLATYGGDADEDALQAYYEKAWNTFSQSDEAKQVIDRLGDIGYFQMLLTYGIDYLGETVDKMTVDSVQDFLFGYVPRKVTTDAENAPGFVFELLKFWEFIDRVYELPKAKSIIQFLRTDGLDAKLRAELSDDSNFGMAKSMMMSGRNAGFDMNSEAGLARFMAAFNASLDTEPPGAKPPSTPHSRAKVGRNEPCPCGSGKKFKKCCIRM